MSKGGSIVFFHPDLGIGGAERLVVEAAVGLQNRGSTVTIFTSHCDPKHCFDEARDGTLDVRVRGNSLFPSHLVGRFAILFAILRQLHLVLQISFSGELSSLRPSAFFVDQLSACIPFLRLLQPRGRVLFYCHFPDKLLATRRGWVKRLYRVPFDAAEQWTTGAADGLVVNSEFTKGVVERVFPGLIGREIGVVYPCVSTNDALEKTQSGEKQLWKGKRIVLSINRFEKKKHVELAVEAFRGLRLEVRKQARLVIAGGYDLRVPENVAYHESLVRLAESHGLHTATAKNIVTALDVPSNIDVLFLLSVPSSLKTTLLHAARLLVYTPANEHFGIVPLEAMLAGVPVLAASSGGPLETVVEGETGWLRDTEDPKAWTEVMERVLNVMSEDDLGSMGDRGGERVKQEFSSSKMAERLENEIRAMRTGPRRRLLSLGAVTGLIVATASLVGVLAWALSQAWSMSATTVKSKQMGNNS